MSRAAANHPDVRGCVEDSAVGRDAELCTDVMLIAPADTSDEITIGTEH